MFFADRLNTTPAVFAGVLLGACSSLLACTHDWASLEEGLESDANGAAIASGAGGGAGAPLTDGAGGALPSSGGSGGSGGAGAGGGSSSDPSSGAGGSLLADGRGATGGSSGIGGVASPSDSGVRGPIDSGRDASDAQTPSDGATDGKVTQPDASSCTSKETYCSGYGCVNLATDEAHCGSCTRVCSTSRHCSAGECVK